MKKRTICIALSLCLLCTLFSGCVQQATVGMGAMGSEVWEEAPALTYGVLESDPLKILPWNSGRLEFTSMYNLAETELGYYYINFDLLCYADKSNIGNWVLVCNKPDCEHYVYDCNASLGSSLEMIVKDNRIYYVAPQMDFIAQIPNRDSGALVLASVAPDGTDRRLEYYVGGFLDGESMGAGMLTGQHWLYYYEVLGKDGNMLRYFSRTTKAGTTKILIDNPSFEGLAAMGKTVRGDEAFVCTPMAAYDYSFFRYIEGELVETDMSGLEVNGAYLSGNTLRDFRPNDGYYDVNLTTREEVFLAPAQLENSEADILLPNCIIETTLLAKGDPGDAGHRMCIFDGEKWREVTLPEELVHTDKNISQVSTGYTVCSDCILLFSQDQTDGYATNVYRIPLTDGELKAEFCAKIRSSPETED